MDVSEGLSGPDTYVIGFTENRYSSMDDYKSPSPTDHLFGYNSLALDYAERSNKGAENKFIDRSLSLERERHKSVGKINHDILDLVFELTERRKTPLLGRSIREEFPRHDSDLSDCSSVSLKSSSSGPTVEVQQLPPLTQASVFPEIKNNKAKQTKKLANKKKKGNLPKLLSVVDSAVQQNRANKINVKDNDSNQQADRDDTKDDTETDQVESIRIKMDKWKAITQKLVEANKLVKNGSLDLSSYKGRYLTPGYGSSRRRMSFCQCSYDERTEKERLDNIRRRHISQARTGPLNFNKLRRQITIGQSKTLPS